MARLRNRATGVVVNVSDDTAERLGAQAWEPADSTGSKKKSGKAGDSAPASSGDSQ